MRARFLAVGLAVSVLACLCAAQPVAARLWKPTPDQIATDYVSIIHIKGTEGRVMINWVSSQVVPSPALKPILDKYVVVSIIHTRPGTGGSPTWDEVQGVQVSDGSGQALKEVTKDSMPPMLIGLIATSDATMRQSTQGNGRIYWGVWEAGPISACQKGKLVVNYDGEAYSFDTPLPSCGKP